MKKSKIWLNTSLHRQEEVVNDKKSVKPNKLLVACDDIVAVKTSVEQKNVIEVLTINNNYFLDSSIKYFIKKTNCQFIMVSKYLAFNTNYLTQLYIGRNSTGYICYDKHRFKIGKTYLKSFKKLLDF